MNHIFRFTTLLAALCALVLVSSVILAGCENGGGDSPAPPSSATYTVTYAGNGSSGGAVPVDSTAYTEGQRAKVLGNTGALAKSGSEFIGWNTAAKGSGTTYQPGGTFKITGNTTLYAQWSAGYTVTYDGNGSDGGTVPVDSALYKSGTAVTAPEQGDLLRTGCQFAGWSTSSFGSPPVYTAGETFTITANTTLYAKWTTSYTITYDGNGNDGGTAPVDSASGTRILGNTNGLTNKGKIFDGWNTKADGSGKQYWPGDTVTMTSDTTLYAVWVTATDRVFNAMKADGSDAWYTVTAKRLAVGTHCIVYADAKTGITAANGQAVAAEYDSKIHGAVTGAFGGIEDVDENNRVVFLLLDIIDGYAGSGGYVAGYFQSYHMYAKSKVMPYSNEADMLFMDTNPGFDESDAGVMRGFYSTMAHELQHLIEYSQTTAKSKAEKDLWINEGLSTAAEYIYGTGTGSPAQRQDRISYFNSSSSSATIPKGNNFFVWNGSWDNDVLADYATAYLFFQWLRIHASNGIGIYKDIIASTYGDYRAVTGPASSQIDSTLSDWATLLRSWLLANYVKDPAGLPGYKGQIDTTVYSCPGTGKRSLSPGEGVFSQITGGSVTANPSSLSPNIKYVGIGSGGSLDTAGPRYDGTRLLTFNANTNKAGSGENGTLANVIGGPYASVQMPLNRNAAPVMTEPLPASYPIDVHFGPDGRLSPDSPRAGK